MTVVVTISVVPKTKTVLFEIKVDVTTDVLVVVNVLVMFLVNTLVTVEVRTGPVTVKV